MPNYKILRGATIIVPWNTTNCMGTCMLGEVQDWSKRACSQKTKSSTACVEEVRFAKYMQPLQKIKITHENKIIAILTNQ